MCLSHAVLATPPPIRDTDDAKAFSAALDAMARRPSWTLRGVLKQPAASTKPGLPRRRFHTKINLNEYWGVLEKVVKVDVSWTRPPGGAAAEDAAGACSMDVDNEVNENLANERFEAELRMDVEVAVDEQQSREPAVVVEPPLSTPEVETAKAQPPAQGVVAELLLRTSLPPSPRKDVIAEVPRAVPASVSQNNGLTSPARREKARRRSAARATAIPASPRACVPLGPPATGCFTPPGGAGQTPPSPCRRVPLGTINGMESRNQLRKSLSPLSTFADNLARRLNRQH